MRAKNNTHIYVAQTSNNRVIPMDWSWWITSNNACETSEQLIVLTNGDDKSDLVISIVQSCLLPRCEALHTCCPGFPTATVAQCIQAVSILLHVAKPVWGLFYLDLNTIDWSRHVASTIRRDNWLGFKSSWLGFRLSAYGQGLGSSFRFAGAVFRVKV